ncbi:lysosomal cholesterol signaling protein isoform 1-T2 [Clarias gariepinus]|uniref:integral membrane protein GPR155 n=1 Tax=Clarias gariepinus TaxID=13013 RepID=UPI00234D0128|nr:integral membrane protein GPR155 [Clarias gariepinus]XP_053351803.1 integral membrane protein GPR155 [Clarias gariepinus]
MDVLSNSISMSNYIPGVVPSSVPPPPMSIEKLLPALLECFGIILCGYIAGRANIITPTQAKGLGNFVSKFALPALLFKNMVLLNFGNVIWSFLWSILVAKLTVFFVVCVLTLVVASKDSRYAKAGLFSIFATQSNDFALGYPIVEALYRNTHPEYLQYIYLVAPISLMVLNPIGFAFCEIQKRSHEQQPQQNKLHVVGMVLLQVLKNPIVFMVVIGIAAHFVLGPKIPEFMQEFVDGLANSFGGAALFYLGLSMVGQLKKLTRSTVVALILLITAKLLVMPLICRGMVEVLDRGNITSQNQTSLSNYAFLYGVFPTAPSVAIYASHYNMELQVMTSGMVISTFLSAPIMYVSAWLLTIPWMDPKPLESALKNISFNISIVSFVALVWCVAVSIMSKKFRRRPHMFTINLFVAQLGVCIGMIAWNFVAVKNNFIGQVLTFTLLYGSLYSTYIWPGLIALSLFLLRRDDELKVRPAVLMLIGWGVPCVAMSILLIVGEKMPDTIDSAFFFGHSQVMCTVIVLGVGIAVAGISLMLLSRGTHEYQTLEHASLNGTTEDLRTDNNTQPESTTKQISIEDGNWRGCEGCECRCSSVQAVPNNICNNSVKDIPSIQPGQCDNCCDASHCLLVEEEQKQQTADRQVARHILLCLLLTVSLVANISSYLWWLFSPVPGRLYLELQFFCAVINFGQGFISFGIFGLDKHLIIIPFKKRLARLMQSRGQEADGPSNVSEEIRITCSQFLKYHKEQCVHDIVQKKRCGEHSVAHTFLGSDMVQWLQTVGLASDQGEALLYGSRLLEGGVIHHITHDYSFQDDNLHYCFTQGSVVHR